MDDNTYYVRTGSTEVITTVVLTPVSGTITVNGTPTISLLDNSNVVIASGVNVTGSAGGATATAWYNLNTAVPPGGGSALTAGNYRIKFTMNNTYSSDGLVRIDEPSALVVVVN